MEADKTGQKYLRQVSTGVELLLGTMANRLTLGLAMVFALAVLAAAQARGGLRGSGHFGTGFATGRRMSSFNHSRGVYPGYLGQFPLFYDDSLLNQPDAAVQVPLMQPVMASADTPPQPRLSPLLIELQGDHYVRYGGVTNSAVGEKPQLRDSRPSPLGKGLERPATPLPPAILIYHDGHREQIPDYAIVGRVLYTHSGLSAESTYGMKDIQLSELDIPATIEANRKNGVNFVLPAGPNEVVTRP